MSDSRAKKSIYNILTSLGLYSLNVLITFFSRSEFLDALGPEVLGLRYTIGNFFALTSLAELGLGSVIGFSLYKPLVDNNREEISEIISLQGWVYRKLAVFELIAAVLFCLASPFIFSDFKSPHWYIYASTLVFAWGTISSYLIGYHSILLGADQKGYKLSLRTVWFGYIKNIAQLLILMCVPNPYPYYLGVEVVVSLAGLCVLEYVVRKEYPWLKIEASRGKELYVKYQHIATKVKQMIVHKIGGVALGNVPPLIMTAYSSLTAIGLYDNYMNVTRNLGVVTMAVFGSLGAGIGSLVAEQDIKRTLKFFDEYRAIVHFVSLLVCFALYNFAHPLVGLWLGEQYIISDSLLGLITLYIYISTSRTSRDSFIYAYGLVADTWAPVTETVINVGLGLLLGYFFGLNGVLIGVIVSLILIPVIWKSIYLHREGFHLSPWIYWRSELKFWIVSGVIIVGGREVLNCLDIDFSTFPLFFLNGVFVGLVVALLSFGLFYLMSSGMRCFTCRMFNIIRYRKL